VTDLRARGDRTAARFTERARAERRRRRVRWAGVLFVLAGLVIAAVLVRRSDLLRVAHVEVSGERRLAEAKVRAVAGVVEGHEMATVDLDAVRRRLEALPEVRRAEVRRDWPRTIRIRLVERRPVAAVAEGTGYALVDSDGVRVTTVAAVPKGLALVRLGPRAAPELVGAALQVMAALPGGLGERVALVHVASPDGIELRTTDGDTIVWGSAEESERKAAVLAVLLRRPGSRYDVSAPDAPAYR
jgi:cell division protein FtsQ